MACDSVQRARRQGVLLTTHSARQAGRELQSDRGRVNNGAARQKKNLVFFSASFGSIVNRGFRSDPSGQAEESLGSHATTSLLQRGNPQNNQTKLARRGCCFFLFNSAFRGPDLERRVLLAADNSADGVKFKQETDREPGEGRRVLYVLGPCQMVRRVACVLYSRICLWTDNRSLPSLSGSVRRDLCSPARQSWRCREGTKAAEIYTL